MTSTLYPKATTQGGSSKNKSLESVGQSVGRSIGRFRLRQVRSDGTGMKNTLLWTVLEPKQVTMHRQQNGPQQGSAGKPSIPIRFQFTGPTAFQ